MRIFLSPRGRTGSETYQEPGFGIPAFFLGLGLGIVAKDIYPELNRLYEKMASEEKVKMGGMSSMAGQSGYAGAETGRIEGPLSEASLTEGVYKERRRVSEKAAPGIFTAESSVSVNKPPVEVYRFWKDFENMPRIMDHIDSVNIIGPWKPFERHARFTSGPLIWDVEITNDIANELITWRSVEGCPVKTQGEVSLEARDYWHDTIVTVSVVYQPPLGRKGMEFAEKFGSNPSLEIAKALRKMKNIIEEEGTA